ncbi:ATP-binding cassette domain-containing protein [Lacrimispora saccharolytica]|uniref:Monosaccharide-transporting ATPase n=1 Tax=Lacrimispora saccharolytica (strain ATCC 35040 / DSM 2544 / NRCC 2533 / WM1) TaxID=610130 RepID=D9R039_LACSW|nr:ATP-binding cassette domain-containing protein [Lacrimispora saccharolytica]ADL04490.1 Monosaccharide-transporting ATPase [[Clostridium] saccharolyticum WM1]QRV21250.1 sugar ABC transporter ATP-binding protein [Lacrimispora saccharolytica]
MRKEILRLNHVTLEENGERYLDNLDFYILQGEIMGFIISDAKGCNQLIRLICHNIPISFGGVYYEGNRVNHYSHPDFTDNRVYVIEERGRLIDSLTISDNLFVMRKGFKKYIINRRVLDHQVELLMGALGLSIDPKRRVSSLNSFERCVTELLKAILTGCRFIILDRVSNFLSQMELKQFQDIIRKQAGRGIAFLYMGNHHQEVFQIADRAALFHHGTIWKVFEKEEMVETALQPYTISFDLSGSRIREPMEEAVLKLEGVHLSGKELVSFSLKRGECLMILDTDNQTWEPLVEVLSGCRGISGGRIFLGDRIFAGEEPKDFFSEGVAVIPDDPSETFLFQDMSYMENLTFLLDRKVRLGNIKRSHLRSVNQEYRKKAGPCIDAAKIDHLSLREKYGLAYYRIHLLHPKVVVCVQPLAKGDMYLRRYVLDLIQELKNSGISVLILTSNLADNMDVSDRMIILQDGKAAAEYGKEEFYKVGW